MKIYRRQLRLSAVIMSLLLCLPTAGFSFQRTINRSGSAGNTYSKNITSQRSAAGYSRNTVKTGPQGSSISRSANSQWDSSNQTWSKDVNRTGITGASSQHTTSIAKTENGYTKESSLSGPQGNSGNKTVMGSWNAETNTWTKSVTTTGGDL